MRRRSRVIFRQSMTFYNVQFSSETAGEVLGVFGQFACPFRVKTSLGKPRLVRSLPGGRRVRSTRRADLGCGFLTSGHQMITLCNESGAETPS